MKFLFKSRKNLVALAASLLILCACVLPSAACLSISTATDQSTTVDQPGGENSNDVGSTATSGYWTDYVSSAAFSGGSGTEDSPYLISCAEDLAYISYAVMSSSSQHFSGIYFEQTEDIDLSAHYWVPIGGHSSTTATSSSYYFRGCYDGGGYVIAGLYTYSSSYNYMGLFGYVYGASSSYVNIHDVGIEDSVIEGSSYVGGFIGYAYYYINLFNCYISATTTITGTANNGYTGGFVGYSNHSVIYNSYILSNVTGGSYVGGFVGCSNNDKIYCCYNGGATTAKVRVGGIVSEGYGTYIYNCYNLGSVTSSGGCVGGIAGMLGASYSYDGYIYNCYNIGDVKGTEIVGGIAGRCSSYSSFGYYSYIINCFNVGSVTATSSDSSEYIYVGGILGYSTDETILYCYFGGGAIMGYTKTYTLGIGAGSNSSTTTIYTSSIKTNAKDKGWYGASGGSVSSATWNSSYKWDFDEIWLIESSENDGYPILQALYNSSYGITLISNYTSIDGTLTDDLSTTTVDYRANFLLSNSEFTYDGYSIIGWSVARQEVVTEDNFSWLSEGSEFTGDESEFLQCGTSYVCMLEEDVTLYAVWMANSYVVTFNSNFAAIDSGAAEEEQFLDGDDAAVFGQFFQTLGAVFEYEGYTLVGWCTTAVDVVKSFDGEAEDSSFTGEDGTFWACGTYYTYDFAGDVTLYAVWKKNLTLFYDETGGYWYFEDGYMPQSVYGDGQTAPEGVSAEDYYNAYTINISTTDWAEVKLFEVDESSYAYVTYYTKSGGAGASAWFNVEPIRWVVAYDETGENEPEEFFSAVSLYVVSFGQMASSGGVGFSTRQGTVQQSLQAIELTTDFEYIPVTSWGFDMFVSSSTKSCVKDDSVSASSVLAVASVEEIDSLGVSYATKCTDFVAFLASGGSSVSGGECVDYWTRDLAYSLDSGSYYGADSYGGGINNGVYVTEDGTLFNARLSNSMGARLSISL